MDQAQKNGLALLLNNVDPKLITINLAEHEQAAAKMRSDRDAANPPRPEGPAKELARLRGELFQLEQHAKHSEIYTNEAAGRVKLLQARLTNTLHLKKLAAQQGNLRGERTYENSVERLETELGTVEQEFARARKVSAGAAIVLKQWPHRERVAELEKIVLGENERIEPK